MNETSNVVLLRHPDDIDDPLTNILRSGAQRLLAQAIEIEAETFLASMKGMKLPDGRERVVRHGHGPTRTIATGIGPLEVERVKIRDRGAVGSGDRIRFRSMILPLWARRTRSLDTLLPVLYLRGISSGDFQDALGALLGKHAPNLSPSVISRLTAEWQGEYEHWQKRDLSARRYVYVWADGVFLQARMEDHSECMLVLTRVRTSGVALWCLDFCELPRCLSRSPSHSALQDGADFHQVDSSPPVFRSCRAAFETTALGFGVWSSICLWGGGEGADPIGSRWVSQDDWR